MHGYGPQIDDPHLSINCANFIFAVLVSFMSGGNTVSWPALIKQLRIILTNCLTESSRTVVCSYGQVCNHLTVKPPCTPTLKQFDLLPLNSKVMHYGCITFMDVIKKLLQGNSVINISMTSNSFQKKNTIQNKIIYYSF